MTPEYFRIALRLLMSLFVGVCLTTGTTWARLDSAALTFVLTTWLEMAVYESLAGLARIIRKHTKCPIPHFASPFGS
jgi:hypothetical protein